jgi:succinyl-CoA synthetase alpha subunit
MSILVDKNTKLVVQGITGREGAFHATRNKAYGTNVVAGVTPGKAGQDVDGIPVFNTVRDAVEETGANTAMVFVPPRFATDALYEAIESGVDLIICITEGIPAHDMMQVYTHLRRGNQTLIGPNCPGIISPGRASVGIMPTQVFNPGRVGLVSRSGTLTYQISKELAALGIGQSSVVGIGGDPVVGSSFINIVTRFDADPETDLIVMVGEIGGNEEEKAAEFIAENVSTGASWQADGSRGRHHHRLIGHRAGQEGGPRGQGCARRNQPDRGRGTRATSARRPVVPAVDHRRQGVVDVPYVHTAFLATRREAVSVGDRCADRRNRADSPAHQGYSGDDNVAHHRCIHAPHAGPLS